MSPKSTRCAVPTRTANCSAGSAATAGSTTSCATASFSATTSARRHPQGAVESDHRAVDHHVAAEVENELRVFLGAAKARRERHAGAKAVLHILRQAGEHRGRENAGRDRHDP